MNTTKDQLVEEMMWARELYIATGKSLGVTAFDGNARMHDFERLLHNDDELEQGRVFTDASSISFTQ